MIWFEQTVSIWLFKTEINAFTYSIGPQKVQKVWQPLWTLLSFKISSMLDCFADISWFFPFPMHASLCMPSWHSSTDISWGGVILQSCTPELTFQWVPSEGRSPSSCMLLTITQLCGIFFIQTTTQMLGCSTTNWHKPICVNLSPAQGAPSISDV